MNLSKLIRLASELDKNGEFKKADSIFRIIESQASYVAPFLPKERTFEFSGNDPFISKAIDPSTLQGTYGYQMAGDQNMPGGFLSNIQGAASPLLFKGLNPQQIQELMKDPARYKAYIATMQKQIGQMNNKLELNTQYVEKNQIRRYFTYDNPQQVETALNVQIKPAIEADIRNQLSVGIKTKQQIKDDYIRMINSSPDYNKMPNQKAKLIQIIKSL
jgi:hypothetical protein